MAADHLLTRHGAGSQLYQRCNIEVAGDQYDSLEDSPL